MTIKMVDRGAEAELLMEGRLDNTTSPEAEKILTELAQKHDRIVLNMAQMDYVSSAGLRVIKRMHMAMRKKGGELVLKNVGKMVMEVFEITGFAGLLKFE